MQKIQTFLHMLRHSLVPYDNYYHVIRKKTPFSSSFKYFALLITLLTFMQIAYLYTSFTSAYSTQNLKTLIPKDLVVTINDEGRLMTNYDRPFILYNPRLPGSETLLVIDPKATPEKILEYESSILLTENSMVTNFNNRIDSFEYARNDSFVLNGEKTIFLNSELSSITGFIIMVALIFAIFAPIVIIIARLAYLLILSIIIFVVTRQFITKLKFKKTFQISLHAATGPMLMEVLVYLFGLDIPYSFWWFTLLTTVFVVASLYEAYIIPDSKPRSKA